jgi:hypothetical protein
MVARNLDVVEGGDVLGTPVQQDGLDPRFLRAYHQDSLASYSQVVVDVTPAAVFTRKIIFLS